MYVDIFQEITHFKTTNFEIAVEFLLFNHKLRSIKLKKVWSLKRPSNNGKVTVYIGFPVFEVFCHLIIQSKKLSWSFFTPSIFSCVSSSKTCLVTNRHTWSLSFQNPSVSFLNSFRHLQCDQYWMDKSKWLLHPEEIHFF